MGFALFCRSLVFIVLLLICSNGFAQKQSQNDKKQPQKIKGQIEDTSQRTRPESRSDRPSRSQSDVPSDAQSDARSDAQSFWFPPWGIPDFDFSIRPILGVSYQSLEATDSVQSVEATSSRTETLTLEGGARLGLENIGIGLSQPGVTFSPHLGYAYGKRFNLEANMDNKTSSGIKEGTYHRFLAGNTTSVYLKMVRYSLGLNFGRIFGEPGVVLPLSQAEIMQDLGLKTTRRTSVHATLLVSRLFSENWNNYWVQRSDLWFHFQFNPFLSAVFDIGPGQDFLWYPQSAFSSSNMYFKALFDWGIFSAFGISGRARYEISAQANQDDSGHSSQGFQKQREPFQNLGVPSDQIARQVDDLSLFFFVGLRKILLDMSIGYVSLYEFDNAFERSGARSRRSTHGFGIHADLVF